MNLTIHLLMGSAVAILYGLLVLLKTQTVLLLQTGSTQPQLASLVSGYLFGDFLLYLMIYGMLVSGVHVVDHHREHREREIKSLELEARLSKAQTQVLKSQFEPHFLFNALNAISALVHKQPDAADRTVGHLGNFLRSSLNGSGRQETTLEEEIEVLAHYLEIQSVRFGERLAISLEVEPSVRTAAVPTLILQPIVENSIRHGLESRQGHLTLRISARKQGGDRLELRVQDDGPGFPEPIEVALDSGVGLSNTLARLNSLYGPQGALHLGNRDLGGAVVTTSLPLRQVERDYPAVRRSA